MAQEQLSAGARVHNLNTHGLEDAQLVELYY